MSREKWCKRGGALVFEEGSLPSRPQPDWLGDCVDPRSQPGLSPSAQDYNRIIKIVNTSPLGSLDFDPDLLDKFLLFARGVQAATEFLPNKLTADGFDWAKYKDLRQQLAKAKSMQ